MAKSINLNLNGIKNLFKGSMQIPFTNQRMPKAVVYGAGGLAIIGGLYLAHVNGWIQLPKEITNLLGGAGGSKGGPVAVGAIIEAPTMIKPDTPMPVKGTFVNEAQEPRPVPQGFWYVIDEKGAVRLSGSLGENVTDFNTTIAINGLESEKDYQIVISDGPANSAEASFAVTV